MNEFSLLVIVHGRADHLRRLLAGVDSSGVRPAEVVIVYMDEPSPPTLHCSVPLHVAHISSADHAAGLPLARARNAAAASATASNLVFLDVDSIPSANLFSTLIQSIEHEPVLAMAEPRYLRKPLQTWRTVKDEQLFLGSIPHHARAGLPRETTMSGHEMFWSLGFAVKASIFADVGGFDEGYDGYGGEDTDFAFRVKEAGIPMRFIEAPVFHQHHGVHSPPLNHFSAIVHNVRRFYARWRVWPMEGWLRAFARMGLISWSPLRPTLIVERTPTAAEIEAAHSTAPY